MNQAEELCDRILLMDKGKIMLEGRLSDIRKQFAKPEILVRSAAPLPADIPGVKAIKTENHHQRILLQAGKTANEVLKEMIKRGVVIDQFEVAEPTLDEIFISVVTGRENS